MALFKNKYRTDSHRLKGWDYAGNDLYCIIIVTQKRECYFGEIDENKRIHLSEFGKITKREFIKSFEIRSE